MSLMAMSRTSFPDEDQRALPPLLAVLACGLLTSTLDLGLAFAWWAHEGVSAARILRGIAAWTLGPGARDGGVATALYGLAFYVVLMCWLAATYRLLACKFPRITHAPVTHGALYGLAAYLLLFGAILPALTQRDAFGPPAWALVCALAWMFLIGVPCALFAANGRCTAGDD